MADTGDGTDRRPGTEWGGVPRALPGSDARGARDVRENEGSLRSGTVGGALDEHARRQARVTDLRPEADVVLQTCISQTRLILVAATRID